ncbi:MAG: hypothetical protein AAGJ79_15635, partial [Verrucomicrobiota bacterium]
MTDEDVSDSSRFNGHLALSALSHLGLILLLIFAFRTLAGSSRGSEAAEEQSQDIPVEEPTPPDVAWFDPATFADAAEAKAIPYAHWRVSTEDPASKIVLPAAPQPAAPSPPKPEP